MRACTAAAALAPLACGLSPVPVPVTPTSGSMKGLTLYVPEPKVSWRDKDCAARASSIAQEFLAAFVKTAQRAGYETVSDAATPADLTTTVAINLSFCSDDYVAGTSSLAVTSGGKNIDTIAPGEIEIGALSNRETPHGWAMYYSPVLLNGMSKSARVREFAEGPHTSVASASQAPPSAPASPLASMTPPGPSPSALPATTFVRGTPQPSAFALVVGIDHYRDVIAAPGARNDAQRFAQLARQTLGIAESHMHVALDDRATKTDIESELAWLKASATSGSRIYFFYSGHGAPDTQSASGAPYLVPYDANAKMLATTAIPLSTVMATLAASHAKDALVILDSCFSGAGGRSVLPPGARPLVRVREETPSAQVALFTASGSSEISGPASDVPLGLFTKYVTEGLGTGQADGDGDGDVSLAELADYVRPRVQRDAKRDHREQTPGVTVGSGIGEAKNFDVAWGFPTK